MYRIVIMLGTNPFIEALLVLAINGEMLTQILAVLMSGAIQTFAFLPL